MAETHWTTDEGNWEMQTLDKREGACLRGEHESAGELDGVIHWCRWCRCLYVKEVR